MSKHSRGREYQQRPIQSDSRPGPERAYRHESESTSLRCPSCGIQVKFSPELSYRKLLCSHCGELIEAPAQAPEDLLLREPSPSIEAGSLTNSEAAAATTSWRSILSQPRALGLASLLLALLGVQVLCLPFAAYAGVVFSVLGLLVGIRGLFLSGRELNANFAYSLAGVIACAVSLAFVIETLTSNRD